MPKIIRLDEVLAQPRPDDTLPKAVDRVMRVFPETTRIFRAVITESDARKKKM